MVRSSIPFPSPIMVRSPIPFPSPATIAPVAAGG